MNHYHKDYETRSRADIKDVGAYRYAADPSTEKLMLGIAYKDEAPVLWDCVRGGKDALEIQRELHNDPTAISYAHNAQFERAIEKYLCEKTFGLKPLEITQWRCTAAMCRRAAIPFSLGGASQFLNLTQKKDKAGSVLIKLFSCIQTSGPFKGQFLPTSGSHKVTVSGQKMTIDEAWHMFGDYCLQDVRTEQAIAKALKAVELRGDVLEAFHFDMRMNERGVPINVDGVHKALKLVEAYNVPKAEEFRQLTGLNPTQREKVNAWLKERGYKYNTLNAETVALVLADKDNGLTPEANHVLALRRELSFAATSKLSVMADCHIDGRAYGMMLWSGAIRTHRWTSNRIQIQNMRKPTFKGSHLAYVDIINGAGCEYLDAVYAPPLEVIASCIRNFLHDPNQPMLDADYAGIEARILAWWAGQHDKLQAFVEGRKIYEEMGEVIFGIPWQQIKKGSEEYALSKQAELSCQYGCGLQTFVDACADKGLTLSKALGRKIIKAYRAKNDRIAASWYATGDAVVEAMSFPGRRVLVKGVMAPVEATYHLNAFPFPALVIKLPSGHPLVYPNPRVKKAYKIRKYYGEGQDDFEWTTISEHQALDDSGRVRETVWATDELSYEGYVKNVWMRIYTHGAKIVENICQAMGGDFMTHGAINAEKQGYEIFMLVHDQALAPYKPEQGNTKQGFSDALCKLPDWATGFPLESTCDIVPFYLKED